MSPQEPTRQELLTLLHYRSSKLEEIRQAYDGPGENIEVARKMNWLASEAFCMGPSTQTLCQLANEEMERNKKP